MLICPAFLPLLFIMEKNTMSKAILAAVAAIVPAQSVDLFQGQPVNPSLVETLEQLGRDFQMAEDAKTIAERSIGKCDVALFDHVKGLNYLDFMVVRKYIVNGCRDKGCPTDDAAGQVWIRAINRITTSCGFIRPKSESKDAERQAAKRAAEAKKYEAKSDAELKDTYAKLVAVGDVKSSVEATAIAKQIAERAKPEMAKLQAEIKLLHETLKKCAADWAKAGTAEAAEMLTAGIMAMSKAK
jgi:hypothetical protein